MPSGEAYPTGSARDQYAIHHGIISAAQPEAAEAGAQVLKRGGNAVDAAVASCLVQTVVDPQMCGLAGFGSMQIYLPARKLHLFIDFHGKAPKATRPDQWQDLIESETRDGFGFVLKGNVNDLGYQSVTVPGTLKAMHEAQKEFGVLPWADVVQFAVDHAASGFIVRPHVNGWWQTDDGSGRVAVTERLAFSKTGKRVYFREGATKFDASELLRVGDRLKNPDLHTTMLAIQKDPDSFYTGALAERIAADFAANGGLLSIDDLRGYKTTRRDAPMWIDYRGWRISTNWPPGGGIMLAEMLNTLEYFDLAAMEHNGADYIRVVAEAMKLATIDKDNYVGDPDFFDVPYERLCSKEYARTLADQIKAGKIARVERVGKDGGQKESTQTTHTAVVDKDMNAVSVTHSLGMPSGVITDGIGTMYNGCMAVFDPRPGRSNSLAPGKSRFSAMAPTMVFDSTGQIRYCLGAPGGTAINLAILQVLLNVLDFRMPIDRAIAAPRFIANSSLIDVSNRIPRYVTDELEAKGYGIVRNPRSYVFAAVHGVEIEADGKRGFGGADPGHDGSVLVV
ncbi:putative gamma-glutamyltranspeptidase [Hyaloraphidium curvatum]|nr:putative gamma-glutamyltranspeptidase [Hyaloraphidium curvatum]